MTAHLVVLAMAVFGIGGGFAILCREWVAEERRLSRSRARCRMVPGLCDFILFGTPGVERGPNWRGEELVRSAEDWNKELKRRRAEIYAKLAEVRAAIGGH